MDLKDIIICVECPYWEDSCPDEECPIYQGFFSAEEV